MTTNHTHARHRIAQTTLTVIKAGLSALALGSESLAFPVPAGAIPMVPLTPDCRHWVLNSGLRLNLDNGHDVELEWSGTTAGPGDARLFNSGQADEIGWGNVSSGGISHGHLDFTMLWYSPIENRDTNHFVGDVDKWGGLRADSRQTPRAPRPMGNRSERPTL